MELRNEPKVRQEQRLVRIIIASTILAIILGGGFFLISNLFPTSDIHASDKKDKDKDKDEKDDKEDKDHDKDDKKDKKDKEDCDKDESTAYYVSGSISNSTNKKVFESCKNGDTLIIEKKLTVNKESEELKKTNVVILIDGGELYWTAKNSVYLGSESKILLKDNGEITVKGGKCDKDAGIYFGETKKVSCDGKDADLSFAEVNNAGGVQLNGVTALPVDLIRFETIKKENSILINWATASEHNNSHFEIERSTKGQEWENVATIPGNGNSQKVIVYEYEDNSTNLDEIVYYRLKQTDFDGAFEYSFVRMVSDDLNSDVSFTSVYPNPVDNFLNVKIEEWGTYQIVLNDQSGQIKYQITTSQNLETINTSLYPMGIYYVTIQNERMKESHKIIIKH